MNKDEDVFIHSTFVDFGVGILPVASEQPVIHEISYIFCMGK